MLQRLDLRGVSASDVAARLPRPVVDGDDPVESVRSIIDTVRSDGDAALWAFAERFDPAVPPSIRVDPAEIDQAWEAMSPEVREALQVAHDGVAAFHATQRHEHATSTYRGISIEARQQPVDRAGCYVPGGRAAYPSTLLMTVVPARTAGVAEVCVCVPPGADGHIAPITLAAAHVAGVDEVYAVGGAQAIAAMAYGTESIAPVDVIAGPGNAYVAIAKRSVAGDVGIAAAFAGPSEIVVIADDSAPVSYAAIDVIVQAEHGPGGLAWLITWDEAVADAVTAEVARRTATSPRRAEIESTLAEGGYAVVVDGPDAAVDVANLIAPEHLQLMVADPDALLARVRHAGAVFLGALSPASVGDYVAGPSHVLPTNGTARFAGALTVADFCKDIHVITCDQAAIDAVADAVATLAEAEGLVAHAESVRIRTSAARGSVTS